MKKIRNIFHILSLVIFVLLFGFYLYRYLHFKGLDKENNKYSEYLSERIIEEEKRFQLVSQIDIKDNNYYFRKSTKNNYLKYKGLNWRIIKINEDKTTLIILDEYISILPSEAMNSLLNDKYAKLVNIDEFDLLTEEEYNMSGGKESFINNKYDFWIADNKYIDSTGEVKDNDNLEHKVRPIYILPSDTKIISGNGNIDNPFILDSTKEVKSIKDIDTTQYIQYNDVLWKIIDIQDNKVKLLCQENLKDKNGENLKYTFAIYNNDIKNYKKNSIIYYLNNDYYKSLKNKEYLVEGTFYIGKYLNSDYSTIYSDFINLKVGLPNIDDPYIYDSIDTFLFTTNNSEISIYTIEKNKLFETFITEKSYVRPVIYMKNNIEIVSGKGTYSDPYLLGGIISEEKN